MRLLNKAVILALTLLPVTIYATSTICHIKEEDALGVEVIACIYDDADDFDNGYARVKTDRKFGVIDTSGNLVVKSKYFNIGKFMEGKAWVDAGGFYGYINKSGDEI